MKPLIYRFILYPGRQLYRFIFQPKTRGVKAIILYKNQILLIKNTYGERKWNVPGGGVNANEQLENAIIREVKEELGITINKVDKLGSFKNIHEYKHDTIWVFKTTITSNLFKLDNAEIAEAKWFTLRNLPKINDCTKTLMQVLTYV